MVELGDLREGILPPDLTAIAELTLGLPSLRLVGIGSNLGCQHGVAADADTVYHVGSVSKAFLGTAYMQLLDQSRVDLDLPLTNYLAEFSMLPRFTNSTVTIHSLLDHHSGIPGDFFNGLWTERLRPDYMDWFINCLQNDYPFAPLNERSEYCNSGFVCSARLSGASPALIRGIQ